MYINKINFKIFSNIINYIFFNWRDVVIKNIKSNKIYFKKHNYLRDKSV